MRITAKSSYALNIIGHLAEIRANTAKNEDYRRVSASEISDQYGLSEVFTASILGELRNSGLIVSKKGPGGGYQLAKDLNEITAKEVFAAISEEPVSYQMELFNNPTGQAIVNGLHTIVDNYLKKPVSEFL